MKLSLSSLILASAGLFSVQVMAVDGTIEFTGTINDNTCAVSVQDGNANSTIDLGSAQAMNLSQAQATAGGATFTLAISDGASSGETSKCDLSGKTGTVRFLPMTGTAGDKNQYLGINTGGAGYAQNVAVRILDEKQQVVPMGADSASYDLTKPLSFTADYISLGQAEAGKVEAKAGFVINYK